MMMSPLLRKPATSSQSENFLHSCGARELELLDHHSSQLVAGSPTAL